MRFTKWLMLILLLSVVTALPSAAQEPKPAAKPDSAVAPVAVPATPSTAAPAVETVTVKNGDQKMPWLDKYAVDKRTKKKEESKEGEKKKTSQYEVESWRLWLVLAILAAMVGGLIFILRKYGRGMLPSSNASVITVKSKIQLDPRNSVALLKIYDEEYVVGAGTNGVTLLAKLLPIEGTESEPENDAEGGLNEKKIERRFIEEFNLAESKIESAEVK